MSPPNPVSLAWSIETTPAPETSVRQQTIYVLRQAILNFQLKPGQRLVERELIERLGVSRTTLREAIRELAAEGLVTVVPQKGARVCAPTYEEAADLYEVRAALESVIVARFVERATDGEITALQGTVANYRQVCGETTDILALLAAKEAFYEVLIGGARSHALQQLIEGIKARVQALRATSLSRPGRAAETVTELEAIAAAIAGRDAEVASRLCAEHLRRASTTALERLRATAEAPQT